MFTQNIKRFGYHGGLLGVKKTTAMHRYGTPYCRPRLILRPGWRKTSPKAGLIYRRMTLNSPAIRTVKYRRHFST